MAVTLASTSSAIIVGTPARRDRSAPTETFWPALLRREYTTAPPATKPPTKPASEANGLDGVSTTDRNCGVVSMSGCPTGICDPGDSIVIGIRKEGEATGAAGATGASGFVCGPSTGRSPAGGT